MAATPRPTARKKGDRRRTEDRSSRTAIRTAKRIPVRRRPARASAPGGRERERRRAAGGAGRRERRAPNRGSRPRWSRRTGRARPPAGPRDPGAGLLVEVPGGLVRQHEPGPVGDGAGDRGPLLLAAGHLGRQMVGAGRQAEGFQHLGRPVERVGIARDLQRHRRVLERGQVREQVERLEDEADVLRAELRESLLVEAREVDPGDADAPGGGRIESGEKAEQRGLAASRRAADGHHRLRLHDEVEPLQDGQRAVPAPDGLLEADGLDHGAHSSSVTTSGGAAFPSSGTTAARTTDAIRDAPSGFGWIPSR